MNSSLIQSLPDSVINQIAAGEVIERPSSVVKELLENALDASATHIEIQIEEGGKKLIRVTDNGSGMSKSDLDVCYLRHTTSKLRTAEDLFRIKTNGFRGEAIASIAAISRLTIYSRPASAEVGNRIRLEGGSVLECSMEAGKPGTSFLAEDLFFNTPVRRTFLGSDALEGSRILDTILRIAIANPEVRFDYRSGNRELFSGAAGDLKSRIAEAIGSSAARNLIPVEYEESGIKITGFVSPAEEKKGKQKHQFYYLHRRPIWNPIINKAVMRAYEPYGKQGYPVAVLFMEIPEQEVDVNVHPAKKEVRFANENLVFLAVHRAVRAALQHTDSKETPVVDFSAFAAQEYPAIERTVVPAPAVQERKRTEWDTGIEQDLFSLPEFGKVIPLSSKSFETPAKVETFLTPTFIQFGKTFLVCEDSEGLLIIDQAAAHQRVLYEEALRVIEEGHGIETQELLFPELLELGKVEALLLESILTNLSSLGFHLEPFGILTYQLRGIPRELPLSRAIEALHEILADLTSSDFDTNPAAKTLAKAWALGNAYQSGDSLSQKEMMSLMEQLLTTENPTESPSGKPTLMRLSLNDVCQKFGRYRKES